MCGVGLHAGAPISIDAARDADAAEQADAHARGALPRRRRGRRGDRASLRAGAGSGRPGTASRSLRRRRPRRRARRAARSAPAASARRRATRRAEFSCAAIVGSRTDADLSVPAGSGLWARSYSRRASASGLSSVGAGRPAAGSSRQIRFSAASDGHRAPRRQAGAGDVRREDDVAAGEQVRDGPRARLRRRRGRRRRSRPSRNAAREGDVVDDAAASDVDERRGRLHQRQLGGADEVMRLGAVRHDDDQVVGLAQQRPRARRSARRASASAAASRRRAVVIDHLHAEAVRAAARDRLADPAHAEDAERRAVHVAAGEQVDAPLRPLAAAQERARSR